MTKGEAVDLEVGDTVDLARGSATNKYLVQEVDEDEGWFILKPESWWERVQRKFSKK